MDISALLSPAEGSPADPSPSSTYAAASGKSRHDSPAIRQSPRSIPTASPTRHVAMQHRPPLPSPPGSGFAAGNASPHAYPHSHSAATPPAEHRPLLQRASTSGMDTLADLASMQQHQHYHGSQQHQLHGQSNPAPRPQTARQSTGDRPGTQQRPRLDEIQRQHSGSRNSIDMSKLDTPKPQPRPSRVLRSASLTDAELVQATQLFDHLAENPHSHESHLQLTRILRKGLRAHALDPSSNQIRQDPRTYELVAELLEANGAMSARFAIGEDLWQERLQDQQLLAFSVEECQAVQELCEQAVNEEAGSTALWQLYGNWMLMLFQAGHGSDADMPLTFKSRWAAWSSEDKAVAGEVFSRHQLVDTWQRGASETMYNISDSHIVWDNFITLLLENLESSPSAQLLAFAREQFERRLKTPHKEWDQTFQMFSQFVSRFIESSKYEETMMWTKHRAQASPMLYQEREVYEIKWKSAQQARDKVLEWSVISEYIEKELSRDSKQKRFSFELSKALYQRALLRFPHVITLWEDFFLFLADELPRGPRAENVLPAMDRGTAHCPWSGVLWGHYIRAGELEHLSFDEMSKIKHRATSKGMLDASPLEDHIIVNTNWCSYLRRRAFERGEVEEEEQLDVTEVGIRSAIEDLEILGKRREGDEYKGDPHYRLERIYIRFCTQVGDGAHIQTARAIWQKLIPTCGHSYEFWQWYFLWERFIWVKNPRDTNISPTPKAATEVLKRAINHQAVDWPERLIEDLLRHAEDYEDPAGQLSAIVAARKAGKEVEKRRALEAWTKQQNDVELQKLVSESQNDIVDTANVSKRRRADVNEADENVSKKPKLHPSEDDLMSGTADSNTSQPKRDRENATIVVRNLPTNVHGRRVRNFFRDCGNIKNVSLDAEDENTTMATIEFENHEDMLAALTRDMKDFEGREISVQVGSGLTVWCANYPAAADEGYIRDKFDKYGEIVDVRFPSLKYNTHRRFCYVQFRSPEQASASTELNGTPIREGDSVQRLVVRISDPSIKQNRSGALEEGRELYVRDVDWSATEDEVRSIFAKYGDVQSVRIPRNMGGKSKGHAFVVFKTPDQANAALDLDKTKLKSRLLNVSIAESRTVKRNATNVVRERVTASPSPSIANGQAGQQAADRRSSSAGAAQREQIAARTIALINVPDTVTDARVRSIAEVHGKVLKIVLRPDHGGAIIEYEDTVAAGKASLALEGYEITPGRRIRTGTVAELKAAKPEKKGDDHTGTKSLALGSNGSTTSATRLVTSGVIRRPGQPSGRRGGLGLKRSGMALGGPRAGSTDGSDAVMQVDTPEGPANSGKSKSNADFKAMFVRSER